MGGTSSAAVWTLKWKKILTGMSQNHMEQGKSVCDTLNAHLCLELDW